MECGDPARGSSGARALRTGSRGGCWSPSWLGGLASLAALALSLLPAPALAAPAARFGRLSVEHGLSQSTVEAILQDHVGFLWLGTEEGLNRYDGYAFVVFRHDPENPASLPNDLVSSLYEDRQRRLWVGTAGGLALFDRERESFTRVPAVNLRVEGFVEDPDGTLWVGTDGDGLFERNAQTGAWVAHYHDPERPESVGGYQVTALLRDRAGRLWIGTRDGGLDRLDESGHFIHHRHRADDPGSLSHDDVWGIAEDAAGGLWVATYGGGLDRLDPETGAFRHYRHRPGDSSSIGTDLLTSLYVDRKGMLWIGTDGAGLQRYEPDSDRFLTLKNDPGDLTSLSQNVVRTMYEDSQGQLWVGTYLGGANVLKKPREGFAYHSRLASDPASLADSAVASFLEDAAGRLWVGTERGWLHRFDRATGSFTRYRLPSGMPGGSAVLALHQDRRGRIWAGAYRAGLFRFDAERGSFTAYPHRLGDPASPGSEVWAIAEGDDETLWLGTDAGVERFDPDRGAVTERLVAPNVEGVGYADVRALLVDRDGNLWVGVLGGLNLRLRGGTGFLHFQHEEDPRTLSHNSVMALHQDARGGIWVGTLGGGVSRLDPRTRAFTSYKGLPSSVVYRIEEEGSGKLWLSTNHGLVRLDPVTKRIETFDLSNGLQTLQFRPGASLATRSGRLLFGGQDGFHDFDPAEIRPDDYAPVVVFTSLRVLDRPASLPAAISTLNRVTLSHRDAIVSLEFAALDYTIPRRNHYSYRLEGLSPDWIPLESQRQVTLTGLDPGRYVFQVKASNADGVWNATSSAALEITIRPPWWATWWFRSGGAALLAGVLLAAHRRRVRQLTADLAASEVGEQALREAEEKYRSIFENSVEGIFQTSPAGRIVTANPTLARMLGFESPEALIAETTDIAAQYYVDPLDRLAFTSRLERLDSIRNFTTRARRRDGGELWVSVSARAVKDAAGTLLYYEGTAEDVTERVRAQQAEEALRLKLEKAVAEWELTFDAIEAPILILDATGQVMRLNTAAKVAAGRPYADILGQPLVDLGPRQPWLEASEVAARSGELRATVVSQVRDEDSGRLWSVAAHPLRGPRGEERTSVIVREIASPAKGA